MSLQYEIICLDLDDTLIPTQKFYLEGRNKLAMYLQNKYGCNSEVVKETQNDIDFKLLQEDGFDPKRYEESFVLTATELVGEPLTEKDLQTIREFGQIPFKSGDEYCSIGYLDGARELISAVTNADVNSVIVTSGNNGVQETKVESLGLDELFDEVCYVSHDTGKQAVFEQLVNSCECSHDEILHIGNSESSDIDSVVSMGGNGIHVPNTQVKKDWLSSNSGTESILDHENVRQYRDRFELANDIMNKYI